MYDTRFEVRFGIYISTYSLRNNNSTSGRTPSFRELSITIVPYYCFNMCFTILQKSKSLNQTFHFISLEFLFLW